MSHERNEPCPCGSGKKYKRCCGDARSKIDPIALNRKVAYMGEIGRRRLQFCLDYTAYKKVHWPEEKRCYVRRLPPNTRQALVEND